MINTMAYDDKKSEVPRCPPGLAPAGRGEGGTLRTPTDSSGLPDVVTPGGTLPTADILPPVNGPAPKMDVKLHGVGSCNDKPGGATVEEVRTPGKALKPTSRASKSAASKSSKMGNVGPKKLKTAPPAMKAAFSSFGYPKSEPRQKTAVESFRNLATKGDIELEVPSTYRDGDSMDESVNSTEIRRKLGNGKGSANLDANFATDEPKPALPEIVISPPVSSPDVDVAPEKATEPKAKEKRKKERRRERKEEEGLSKEAELVDREVGLARPILPAKKPIAKPQTAPVAKPGKTVSKPSKGKGKSLEGNKAIPEQGLAPASKPEEVAKLGSKAKVKRAQGKSSATGANDSPVGKREVLSSTDTAKGRTTRKAVKPISKSAPKPSKEVSEYERRLLELNGLILRRCCGSDANPSSEELLDAWETVEDGKPARPSIPGLAAWGSTWCASFSDRAARDKVIGVHFENLASPGHTCEWVSRGPDVGKVYMVSRISLSTAKEVQTTLAREFGKEPFKLFRSRRGVTLLDTYVVEFEKIPGVIPSRIDITNKGGRPWNAEVSLVPDSVHCAFCKGPQHALNVCERLGPACEPKDQGGS